ncbi:hypothetical protein [Mycolicibacterium arenosum]|uniref:Integrase n=1 Tax=Mycolicibacterium arenosum TaxID=2952157 RepID=A0ABT1MAX5_9MYCO|nr:hypothetical protein [Mycolicibacterium sp. CAU 1645]MCP9276331.1 hypothetical protein [Mycolicibacterium sp. CAU 1645]
MCAGAESIFACRECGREDHPYGSRHCARCVLRERLTDLLTDPRTGRIHHRLQPVFEELIASDRPQNGVWWLRKKPGTGPRLLAQMACGAVEISHDTFRALPSDRSHDYLRSLLVAVGVLTPIDLRIERMHPWLEETVAGLSTQDAALIRRFAHWRVLRSMRRTARENHLTRGMADAARRRIRMAIGFLVFLDTHGSCPATATQDLLERYHAHVGRSLNHEYAFIAWLRECRINTRLTVPDVKRPPPEVTVSDAQRWDAVEHLLHDATLRRYTRIAGLFTVLFAQPLSRIVAMRTDRITLTDDGVDVAFHAIPIRMPPVLDDLIREHLAHRATRPETDHGWLFPGRIPGHHLATENIRAQLVAIEIKPYEHRKAALFGLAGDMPAPVLAELIGITDRNAAAWAALAARDWTGYIADRAR